MFNKDDAYIYYGGAYTLEEYRHHGIKTRLERYALTQLQEEVRAVVKAGAHRLFYLYGVVEENFGGSARLRSFLKFVRAVMMLPDLGRVEERKVEREEEEINLSFYAFNAYKPTFHMVGHELQVKPRVGEEGKGFGCIIGCDL